MKYFVLLLSLLIVFSCSETPIIAPIDHNSSLEGFVRFEDGSPNSITADVTLYRQGETNIIRQTQTDTTGFYHFDNLTSGIFQINLSAIEFETFTLFDTLFLNETTIADTIQLNYILSIQFKEISIDGEIDEGWESSYENNQSSNWGTSNDFENLYLAMDENNLFIAVRGGFDSGGNTVNIYIDKDYGIGTGLNDFSNISGGAYGDHLRKNITTSSEFGADAAFTAWALNYDIGLVSLEDEFNVDQNIIEESTISSNNNVFEFAIPFTALYENGEVPFGGKIALVSVIGGGSDDSFSDDTAILVRTSLDSIQSWQIIPQMLLKSFVKW